MGRIFDPAQPEAMRGGALVPAARAAERAVGIERIVEPGHCGAFRLAGQDRAGALPIPQA
jgi:hypothetical protein